MLSPVSPSKSVNLGLVWGTPNTHGDSIWNLLKFKLPDTSQEPTLQADISKDSGFKSAVSSLYTPSSCNIRVVCCWM